MSTPKRLAVIEAGSKGIRLLVVRRRESPPGMDILESRGEVGNLGEALGRNAGRMRRDNIRASLLHVRRFFRLARRRHADRIELVGTEVFRRAANVNEFRDSLPEPLTLRILAPEEEAVGSFFAACWGLRRELAPDRRLLVIDLGGGSLEVVAGRAGSPPSPEACVSLRTMGTLALREAWHHAPNPDEREHRFSQYIESQIDRHRAHFRAFRAFGRTGSSARAGRIVAGLGSTVTDSAWLLSGDRLSRYKSRYVNGKQAEWKQLRRLHARLAKLTAGSSSGSSSRRPASATRWGTNSAWPRCWRSSTRWRFPSSPPAGPACASGWPLRSFTASR